VQKEICSEEEFNEYNIELIYSDDYFRTNTSLLKSVEWFYLTRYYLAASEFIYPDDSNAFSTRIYCGNANARIYELEPLNVLPNKSSGLYYFGDFEGERISINVDGDRQGSFADLYVSDSTGRRFVRSIQNIRYGKSMGKSKIAGPEDVSLLNIYDSEAVVRAKNISDETAKSDELEKSQMTRISFNKGGTWKSLLPPKADSKGKKIKCEEEDGCALHLPSSSDWFSDYEVKSFNGIVVGVGNVGKYLSLESDELNTYLSRDGGLTWNEVRIFPFASTLVTTKI
jgi:hypothetical protein